MVKDNLQSKRWRHEVLRSQLDNERSSFISHWRSLNDFILPRRARFDITDVNKGDRRTSNIVDATATMAVRTLRSGMMAGVTSPARPWFRLTTPDPQMAEIGPVKQWLYDTAQIMSTSFLRSNLYNVLPVLYGDLGVFGTAPIYVEEDFDNVMHFSSFPIGSYMIAKDHKGKINTFIREFRMTVRQIVEMFAERDLKTGKYKFDNMSVHIQNMWDQGNTESWIDVVHCVMPNDEFNPKNPSSKYKKYSSTYYERGTYGANGNYLRGNDDGKYLRESGYDYFPVLVPRWETTGEDVYGTDCPGMTALGDIKQLQSTERRIGQAIDKMVNPPMTGPSSLRTQKATIISGDITYVDSMNAQAGFRPAHEVNLRVSEAEQKQDQVRHRIQRAFFEDLFLMLAQSDRRMITAREIDERHEEKLLALGPVLEQLNQDLLDPLIDIAFDMHTKQRWLPPAPEELHGVPLKVEYISTMAQAQKLIGITGVERFVGFVGNLAQFDPTVLDKVDRDELIDVYSEMTSIPPSIVVPDDDVKKIRDQRAQQQQQQQQVAAAQQVAATTKDLSQAPAGGDTALSRMFSQAGGASV